MTTVLRALTPLQTHDGPRHAYKSVTAEDQAATLAWAEQEGWLNDRSLPASYGLYNAVILVGKQHAPYLAQLEEVPAAKLNTHHDDHGRFSAEDGNGGPNDRLANDYEEQRRLGAAAERANNEQRRFADQAAVDKATVGEYRPYSPQLVKEVQGGQGTQEHLDAMAGKIADHLNRINQTTPTRSSQPHLDSGWRMLGTYRSTKSEGLSPSYQKTPLVGAAMAADRAEGEMWKVIGRVPRVPGFHK